MRTAALDAHFSSQQGRDLLSAEYYAVGKIHVKQKCPAVVKRLRIVRFRTEKQSSRFHNGKFFSRRCSAVGIRRAHVLCGLTETEGHPKEWKQFLPNRKPNETRKIRVI